MRPNLLSLDMDFRVIPSAIPLHSPSPDRKSPNVITPTISPNAIEIKKASTPIKITRTQKQNLKNIREMETELKYHSHSDTSSSALKQKDDIIKNLKNIIDMITDNSRYKKGDDSELKSQVKILTIENQKLVNIIEKMSKNKNLDELSRQNQQEQRISELLKKLKDAQAYYQQQTKQLKKLNKGLNIQNKSLENQKKELELENKKLLRILKQKNQGDRINSEKMKLSETSEHSIDEKMQTMTTNKSQQKLSLVKIREQHSQNLKILKEGLIKQIEETFDTMKIAVDGMSSKINGLAKRLESIQKMTWARVRKTHIERQSITISIREEDAHEGDETDRSFRIQRKNNSEIYIEQGPSSSHERASQDEFARLEEVSSQKNLVNLEQVLAATRTELNQLRFKYEKLCLDTSSMSFSQREKPDTLSHIEQKYEECLRELEKKDKQIQILYQQIGQIEQENLGRLKQKQRQIQDKLEQIQQLRISHDNQRSRVQKQTELKVTLLIQNYEKQLEILHKQILNSNKVLQSYRQAGESQTSEQLRYNVLENKNNELAELLKSSRLQVQALEQKYQYQHNLLSSALQQSQKNSESERLRKQQLEQQSLVLISQVNQHKNYIESLKYELSAKSQQFENMKNLSIQSQENCRKQIENNKKLRELLMEREAELSKIRKLLAQWVTNNLLSQVDQITLLLQKTQQHGEHQFETVPAQFDSIPSGYKQLAESRQQTQRLRQQLMVKEQLIAQLQARIFQLQNLYETTKTKFKQQQDLYLTVMDKLTEAERNLGREKSEREKAYQKWKSMTTNSKEVMTKVGQVRQVEQARVLDIEKLLQGMQHKKIQ